jgi:hypothetical protein
MSYKPSEQEPAIQVPTVYSFGSVDMSSLNADWITFHVNIGNAQDADIANSWKVSLRLTPYEDVISTMGDIEVKYGSDPQLTASYCDI